jgi:hypothetical protein
MGRYKRNGFGGHGLDSYGTGYEPVDGTRKHSNEPPGSNNRYKCLN